MSNITDLREHQRQEQIDSFYAKNGKCCAGCDWWIHVNSRLGECTKSAPVAGDQRYSMLGLSSVSLRPEAGHILTPREHRCGDFKDEFDWSALPANYLRKIGKTA